MNDSIKKIGPQFAVILVIISYLVVCPYTKVEESFNIQAIHDILYNKKNLSLYDHHEFPGVVPRSFIGPVFISLLSLPSVSLISTLCSEKFIIQYIVRFWIGCSILLGMCEYTSAVHRIFGSNVKQYFLLITATQFHFLFYATRPLPNTFAHIFVFPALAAWLKKEIPKFIWLSAFVIIVFRFELFILLGACLLISFLRGHASLRSIFINAVPAGCITLGCTIGIDSLFWERWLWPEGEVAWFNIVLNKSSEWGTLPVSWYFSSVLPRVLLTSAVFIPWGFRSDPQRCSFFLIPALVFVLAFSYLPHKELRFIYYTFPLFNVVAARAYGDLCLRYYKGLKWKFLYLLALFCFLVNLAGSSFFLVASSYNYPGGEIMQQLHNQVSCSNPVHIHISNYAAQTGVTRFTQICSDWRYNKTEKLDINALRADPSITHVIAEFKDCKEFEEQWFESHSRLAVSSVFSGFSFEKSKSLFNLPVPVVRTTPVLVLWQRKSFL